MKLFSFSLLIAMGTVLDLLFIAVMVMVNSAFIHSNWWETIPAFSFGESFLISVLVNAFLFVFSMVGDPRSNSTYIATTIISVLILPFIVPLAVDWANDGLFTSMPDISIGTVFVLSLIGAGFGLVKMLLSRGVGTIGKAVLEL